MLSYIADHADRAVSQLFFQFRYKPRWVAFVTALAIGVQNLENAAYGMTTAFDLETASGQQLEFLGALVGEAREGVLDDEYRRAIRARIVANRSHGTNQDMYDVVVKAALDPASDTDAVTVSERYPQLIDILVTTERTLTATERARIRRLAELAKGAGISLRMIQVRPDSLAFHARGSGEQTFDGPKFGSFV